MYLCVTRTHAFCSLLNVSPYYFKKHKNFYGWKVYSPQFCSNMWLLVDRITRAIASASTKFPNRWKRRKKEFLKFSRGNCDRSYVSYKKGTATSVKAFSLTANVALLLDLFLQVVLPNCSDLQQTDRSGKSHTYAQVEF